MSPRDEESEYVRAEAVPAWMAALAKQVIPAALIGAVGTGILTWHLAASNAGHIRDLKAELRDFKKPGKRFTRRDGERLEARVMSLESWRHSHTAWGREKVGHWDELHEQHNRRLQRLEDKK